MVQKSEIHIFITTNKRNYKNKYLANTVGLLYYLRTLDSSVSKSIRNLIPTDTRAWNTALIYLERGITNSDGLAL